MLPAESRGAPSAAMAAGSVGAREPALGPRGGRAVAGKRPRRVDGAGVVGRSRQVGRSRCGHGRQSGKKQDRREKASRRPNEPNLHTNSPCREPESGTRLRRRQMLLWAQAPPIVRSYEGDFWLVSGIFPACRGSVLQPRAGSFLCPDCQAKCPFSEGIACLETLMSSVSTPSSVLATFGKCHLQGSAHVVISHTM